MEQIKIENFSKVYSDVSFPEYVSLDSESLDKTCALIYEKLGLTPSSGDLLLVSKIDRLGEVCKEVTCDDEEFSLRELILSCNLDSSEYVYINWNRYDDIDKMTLVDLDKYFDDIWYPSVDDIDIFDDSLAWIVSVSHFGQVKVLKL